MYKINSSPVRQLLKLFQPYVEMYHTSTILFGSCDSPLSQH
jgi:hypothetical protein